MALHAKYMNFLKNPKTGISLLVGFCLMAPTQQSFAEVSAENLAKAKEEISRSKEECEADIEKKQKWVKGNYTEEKINTILCSIAKDSSIDLAKADRNAALLLPTLVSTKGLCQETYQTLKEAYTAFYTARKEACQSTFGKIQETLNCSDSQCDKAGAEISNIVAASSLSLSGTAEQHTKRIKEKLEKLKTLIAVITEDKQKMIYPDQTLLKIYSFPICNSFTTKNIDCVVEKMGELKKQEELAATNGKKSAEEINKFAQKDSFGDFSAVASAFKKSEDSGKSFNVNPALVEQLAKSFLSQKGNKPTPSPNETQTLSASSSLSGIKSTGESNPASISKTIKNTTQEKSDIPSFQTNLNTPKPSKLTTAPTPEDTLKANSSGSSIVGKSDFSAPPPGPNKDSNKNSETNSQDRKNTDDFISSFETKLNPGPKHASGEEEFSSILDQMKSMFNLNETPPAAPNKVVSEGNIHFDPNSVTSAQEDSNPSRTNASVDSDDSLFLRVKIRHTICSKKGLVVGEGIR